MPSGRRRPRFGWTWSRGGKILASLAAAGASLAAGQAAEADIIVSTPNVTIGFGQAKTEFTLQPPSARNHLEFDTQFVAGHGRQEVMIGFATVGGQASHPFHVRTSGGGVLAAAYGKKFSDRH